MTEQVPTCIAQATTWLSREYGRDAFAAGLQEACDRDLLTITEHGDQWDLRLTQNGRYGADLMLRLTVKNHPGLVDDTLNFEPLYAAVRGTILASAKDIPDGALIASVMMVAIMLDADIDHHANATRAQQRMTDG